jgi:hypothetical protein
MGKGKKEKEGYSPVKLMNLCLPFQLPYQEWHIVAAAQGAGGEAAEDKDQDIIYEDVYFVPLVGGLLLHLD